MAVARHYVTVGHRQIHYRRAGAGPPIVLLHSGLGASSTFEPLIEHLARRFTAIALDLPGCGASSSLPTAEPRIADYASAVREAIAALGLERVFLHGKHTGAKIAVALAVAHPEVVEHLTLDVLSLATAEDPDGRLAAYAPALEPVWHGGHLLELWHQVRNTNLFFPWHVQTAKTRLVRDMATAETRHAQIVDILCAEADYRALFAANFHMDANPVMRKLRVPTTILVHSGDPTWVQVRQANALPDCVEVATLEDFISGEAAVAAAIIRAAASTNAGCDAPPPPATTRLSAAITRDYVETEFGRLHVRMAGPEDAPPLAMLHAGPGSARGLEPLIGELASHRSVLAFDTLGHGNSDVPGSEDTDIGFYADSVAKALDRLGVESVDIFGSHTGALIAIEIALRNPKRARRLVLDGIPLFTERERDDLVANYIPVLRPVDDGTHLIRFWHMLRDMALFWPWYRYSHDAIRPFEPPDQGVLQKRMVDAVPALTTYQIAYKAAFTYPTRERLPLLQSPALVCAGPTDPLLPVIAEAARLGRRGELGYTAGTGNREAIAATADTYAHFLDG